MKVSTEIVYKIYNDDDGVWIEVGPDPDGICMVNVRTVGQDSISYFGDHDLKIPVDMADRIAKAISDCAKNIKEADNVKTK
jgi:hypothetical protein